METEATQEEELESLFKTIRGESIPDLCDAVNKALRDGWTAVGFVHVPMNPMDPYATTAGTAQTYYPWAVALQREKSRPGGVVIRRLSDLAEV